MRPELSRRVPRRDGFTGPNWRGIGRVEVSGGGVAPDAVLVVDFDRRHVVAGGPYLVAIDGVPELLQFKRLSRGLSVRIGSRWVDVTGDYMHHLAVIGRVLSVSGTTESGQR